MARAVNGKINMRRRYAMKMVTVGSPGGCSGTLWAVGINIYPVRRRCLPEKQRKSEVAMVFCSSTESKEVRSFGGLLRPKKKPAWFGW